MSTSQYYSVKVLSVAPSAEKRWYKDVANHRIDAQQLTSVLLANDKNYVYIYLRFTQPVLQESVCGIGECVFMDPARQVIEQLRTKSARRDWMTHLINFDKCCGDLKYDELQLLSFETNLRHFINGEPVFHVSHPFLRLFPEYYPYIRAVWLDRRGRVGQRPTSV